MISDYLSINSFTIHEHLKASTKGTRGNCDQPQGFAYKAIILEGRDRLELGLPQSSSETGQPNLMGTLPHRRGGEFLSRFLPQGYHQYAPLAQVSTPHHPSHTHSLKLRDGSERSRWGSLEKAKQPSDRYKTADAPDFATQHFRFDLWSQINVQSLPRMTARSEHIDFVDYFYAGINSFPTSN